MGACACEYDGERSYFSSLISILIIIWYTYGVKISNSFLWLNQ